MVNAERILLTLDRHLDHEVRLILYGRAAIALGFPSPPDETLQSMDVDTIIPGSQERLVDEDMQFWDARDATNAELKKDGLYITHLFMDYQVFLRRQWEKEIVAITRPPMRWLRLFRPATLDFILTKMMRGNDEQDMADIAFMIRRDGITVGQIESAFADAVIPEMQELRDAFERAKPAVLALARGEGR